METCSSARLFALVGRQPAERVARALLQRDPPPEPGALARVQDVLRLERQVALEAEDDGGLLQAANFAHGRYVL